MITATLAYLPIFINRILKLFDKRDFHLTLTIFLTFQSNPLPCFSKMLENSNCQINSVFYRLTIFSVILRMDVEIAFFSLSPLGYLYLRPFLPIKQLRNVLQIIVFICTLLPKVRIVRTYETAALLCLWLSLYSFNQKREHLQLKTNHEELIKSLLHFLPSFPLNQGRKGF